MGHSDIPEIPPIEIDLEDLPGSEVVALLTVDTWRADHFNADLTPTLWGLAEKDSTLRGHTVNGSDQSVSRHVFYGSNAMGTWDGK